MHGGLNDMDWKLNTPQTAAAVRRMDDVFPGLRLFETLHPPQSPKFPMGSIQDSLTFKGIPREDSFLGDKLPF